MAEPLKNQFGPEIPRRIAGMIAPVYPSFRAREFVAECLDGYPALELTPRAWKIALVLRRYLPDDYEKAVRVLVKSLGPPLPAADSVGMAPFIYLPHVLFVGEYGLEHFETSMRAQRELTRRFTAEFSIRRFLERDPRRTLARLRVWARDPDVHVRRLVSEGTRPRLPWAPRLRAFQKNPSPVLPLLELLKDDPELYVRRSVANHLNDIGKDHPDLLVEICRRWGKGATPERRWLIQHALRSAVKRGHPGALAVLGYDAPEVSLTKVRLFPKRARIGQTVELSFGVVNRSPRRAKLNVDFRVHFVKARGRTGAKVFKLKAVDLNGGERIQLRKRISLAQMTTRAHYPGRHRVEVIVNGCSFPAGAFEVVS